MNPQYISRIDGLWGHQMVNQIAHIDNTQFPVLNSRFWCPSSSAVDAFTVNWSDEINWSDPTTIVSFVIQAVGNPLHMLCLRDTSKVFRARSSKYCFLLLDSTIQTTFWLSVNHLTLWPDSLEANAHNIRETALDSHHCPCTTLSSTSTLL